MFDNNYFSNLEKKFRDKSTQQSQSLNYDKDITSALSKMNVSIANTIGAFNTLHKNAVKFALEDKKETNRKLKQLKDQYKLNDDIIKSDKITKQLLTKQISLAKEEIRLTTQKIQQSKTIDGFGNLKKFHKQIGDLNKTLLNSAITEKQATQSKNLINKTIKDSNNQISRSIVEKIQIITKGNLSFGNILTTAGSSINKFIKDEMQYAKENKITHEDFIKNINKRIETENLATDIIKDSTKKRIDMTNKEIFSMEQRISSWKKEDVIKYQSLLKERQYNKNLSLIVDQSTLRYKKEKEISKQFSSDMKDMAREYSEGLTDKILTPIRNLPIIGEALGKELGDKLEKSLAPKFEKAFGKMLFKKGNVENGLDPVKLGGMLSSLATAAVATAGLVLVIGGLVAVGYAFYKIFDSIVGKAGEFDKIAIDTAKSLGAGYSQGYKLAGVIQKSYVNLSKYGVEQDVIAENAKEIYENYGHITENNINLVTKLTNGYNIAASSAAKLVVGFQRVFGYSEQSMDRFFSELQGQANVAGISMRDIIEDVSGNWEDIVSLGSKNVKNIVEATVKAKTMGNTMSSVTKLRDSFKDLPGAFEKAAQLSFLTGKSVNAMTLFQKAQMGDVNGLQDIIIENMKSFEKGGKQFKDVPLVIKDLWAEITGQSQEELANMFAYSHKTTAEIQAMRKGTEDWENALSNTQDLWSKIKDIASNLYLKAIYPLVDKAKSFFESIRKSMDGNAGIKKMGEIFERVGGYLGTAWDSASKIFNLGRTSGLGFWESMQETIANIANSLQDFFTNKFDGVKTKFEDLLTKIKDVSEKIWDIFTDDKAGVWDKIKMSFETLFNDLVNPIASMLKKAIFKTSPTLASALGISGVDIARENAATDWDANKNDSIKKGKMIADTWSDLNAVKDIVRPGPFGDAKMTISGNDDNLKRFKDLADKYNIKGVDNYKIEKLTEVLEGQLRTFEDFERNYQLSKKQYGPETQFGSYGTTSLKDAISNSQWNGIENIVGQNLTPLGGMASGGLVKGSGSGKSDSILKRLSNGEFIMNANATSQYRPILETMNSPLGKNIFVRILETLEKGLGIKNKSYLQIISEYFDNRLKNYKNEQINDYEMSKVGSVGNDDPSLTHAVSKKAMGGMLDGPSHSQGGIPARVGGKGFVELEGGEAIINKRSMKNPNLRRLASMINTAHGGKQFAKGGFVEFADALAQRESGGQQDIVNKYGYMGLYQFGKSTLKTLGINATKEQFLSNRELQNEALRKNIDYTVGTKDRFGFSKYYGQNMYGTTVTPSGVYGAAHLKGAGGARKLLRGQDNSDAFGTKASEYLIKFGDYDLGLGNYGSSNSVIKRKKGNMAWAFGDGGQIGVNPGRLPQYGDEGKINIDTHGVVHDAIHRVVHVGAEELLHKLGAGVLGKALPFAGNLFDPTPLAGSTKTPEMIQEELSHIPYGPEDQIGPKRKKARGGMIEPIARTSLMGIKNLMTGIQNVAKKNVENKSSSIPYGPINLNDEIKKKAINSVRGGYEMFSQLEPRTQDLWFELFSKFGNQGLHVGSTKRSASQHVGNAWATSRHNSGLALDILGNNELLDQVAQYLATKNGYTLGQGNTANFGGLKMGANKPELLWRTKGHYDHLHAAVPRFRNGGFIKASDGMEALIDGPTEMSLGGRKILTGDNSSGKESVQIQSKENKDAELNLKKEMVALLKELVSVSKKSGNMKIYIDGKESANSTIKHIVNEIMN